MPTKEEILSKVKIDYSKLSCPEDYAAEVLFLNALEEYAKQEALEFISFNREHDFKYMGWYYADVWNEYQKSKLKK